jgi:peptidoglycan L-alanyl-D-glutamate endopeptidase CwlK
MYSFGKTSMNNLKSCHKDLIDLANEAIKSCPIDFGISCGYRDLETQLKLFNEGKSKCDGINNKSKHNYFPSEAFDFFGYVNGKADYDPKIMAYIAAWIQFEANLMGIKTSWGGLWTSFIDLPHIELK